MWIFGFAYIYPGVQCPKIPKIHKNKENPPYRPIISQIGTATYDIAKQINKLIYPYLNKTYTLNSTYDFINIIKTVNANKLMVSIDVENLY